MTLPQPALDRISKSVATLGQTIDLASSTKASVMERAIARYEDAASRLAERYQHALTPSSGADGSLSPSTAAGRVAAACQEVQDAFTALNREVTEADAWLDDRRDEWLQQIEWVRRTVDEADSTVAEAIGPVLTLVEDGLPNAFSGKADTIAGELNGVTGKLDEHLEGRVTAAIESANDTIAAGLTASAEEIEEALNALRNAIDAAFRQVVTRLGEGVRASIEQAGRDIVNATIDAAVTDVTESVTMSQAGAQITTALAPYVPALVAASKLMGPLQDLLRAARMGV
jgi:hypothetical protein